RHLRCAPDECGAALGETVQPQRAASVPADLLVDEAAKAGEHVAAELAQHVFLAREVIEERCRSNVRRSSDSLHRGRVVAVACEQPGGRLEYGVMKLTAAPAAAVLAGLFGA